MRSISPRTSLAISGLLAQAGPTAEGLTHSVRVLADTMADYMEKIHGGEFRIQIDHECGFVLVTMRSDRPIAKPRIGEVA